MIMLILRLKNGNVKMQRKRPNFKNKLMKLKEDQNRLIYIIIHTDRKIKS